MRVISRCAELRERRDWGYGAVEARTHRASRGRDRDWTAGRGSVRLRRRRAPRAQLQRAHVPCRVADAGADWSGVSVWYRDDDDASRVRHDGRVHRFRATANARFDLALSAARRERATPADRGKPD